MTDDTSMPKKEAFALFFGLFSGHLFDNPAPPCCLSAKLERREDGTISFVSIFVNLSGALNVLLALGNCAGQGQSELNAWFEPS